jgi:uncharacterized protein YcsI (UPF0317 family)
MGIVMRGAVLLRTTPGVAVQLPLAITHQPGKMFVSDLKNVDLSGE